MAGVVKYKTKKEKKLQRKRINAYNTKFVKETYKRFEVKCRLEDEIDIIEYLMAKENRTDYIKELIRRDMESNV